MADFDRLQPPPAMARHEALAEANRCLMCWHAPCIKACPTGIDVPGFIKRIASGDDIGAARTILDANILGSSCARVCPTEVLCEGACVLHGLHRKPIEIGHLQGFATDPVVFGGVHVFEKAAATGKRVAVVGSGPAGLSCAAELALRGHEVDVIEASLVPGGLNSHGVAEYKLDQPTSLVEVGWIEELGVHIRTGTTVGEDIAVAELLDGYDAVFLGVGLGSIPELDVPGEHLEGYEDALDFIAGLKATPHEEMSLAGEAVAVIGGGNTAIDAVIQAARLGADKVYLVYRRGRSHMRAYDHEIEKAKSEGVEFVFWSVPMEVEGHDAVTGLRCEGRNIIDGEFVVVPDSEFLLDVTRVLRATGQAKRVGFLGAIDGVATDDAGRVEVTETFRTGNPKVWAGGDCVNGGKEVVNAVAHGKRAAIDIDNVLSGR